MTARTAQATAKPIFRGPLAGQRPLNLSGLGGDPWLILAVAALVGLGLIMVFNVSYFHGQERFGDALVFFRKQLLGIGLGVVALGLASRVPADIYRRAAYPLLAIALVALVLVLIPGIGSVRGGARRWMVIGPLSLQPTEFAKIAIVLYLAHSLTRKGERVESFKIGVLPHALVVGLMAGLAVLEPDFGTLVLAAGLLIAMLYVGGVRIRHLGFLAFTAVPALGLIALHKPHVLERIFGFLNPDVDPLGVNFQLQQSFIAFGSGGLWGVGLGESRQKMFYLPEAHTDFIFSVVGEELGLLGALLVLALFTVVAVRGFRIALRHPDPFASLLAFGVTLSIVLQVAVNVGVVLGCLPTKGLALPFLSYGGSAMIASLAQIGVLLALAREVG